MLHRLKAYITGNLPRSGKARDISERMDEAESSKESDARVRSHAHDPRIATRLLLEPSLDVYDLFAHALQQLQPRFALLRHGLRERQCSQTLPTLVS